MSNSQNKKWRTYCKQSGNDISFADFCELENKYASERISKEELLNTKFRNDHGSTATQPVSETSPQPGPYLNKEQPVSTHVEDEDDKILGMPRKVAIGVFALLAILILGGGIYWFISSRNKNMPGTGSATGEGGKGNPAPASSAEGKAE